jgi:hypothetical protein
MDSTAFVMVSTIAFMDGEGGIDAMVKTYSGEWLRRSTGDLPTYPLGGCRSKCVITCCVGMKVVRILSVRPKGSDTQMVRLYPNLDI